MSRPDGAPEDYPRGRVIQEDSRFSHFMWILIGGLGLIITGMGAFALGKLWEIDGRARDQAGDVKVIIAQQSSYSKDIQDLRGQVASVSSRLQAIELRQAETLNSQGRRQ